MDMESFSLLPMMCTEDIGRMVSDMVQYVGHALPDKQEAEGGDSCDDDVCFHPAGKDHVFQWGQV